MDRGGPEEGDRVEGQRRLDFDRLRLSCTVDPWLLQLNFVPRSKHARCPGGSSLTGLRLALVLAVCRLALVLVREPRQKLACFSRANFSELGCMSPAGHRKIGYLAGVPDVSAGASSVSVVSAGSPVQQLFQLGPAASRLF